MYVLTGVIIFNIFEILPLSILTPSVFVYPVDIFSTSPDQTIIYDGQSFSQFELIIYSTVFVLICFILRSIAALFVLRNIGKLFRVSPIPNISNRRIYLIMGAPLYSIITLFFSASIVLPSAYLYMLVLSLEIRMFTLTWLIPRFSRSNKERIEVVKYIKYSLAITAALSALLHIVIVRAMPGVIFDLPLISISMLVFLVFLVGVGIGQVVWSIKTFSKGENIKINFLIGTSIALIIFWLILEIVLNNGYYNVEITYNMKRTLSKIGLITLSYHSV